MFFEFGEYLPDQPDLNNPGLTEALNIVPSEYSYQPLQSQVEVSGALDARCQGAFATIAANGTAFNFAGDEAKLYELSGATWSDVSLLGGYITGSDEQWQFAQYGQFIYATNFTDNIQVFELGVSSAFADLGGTPPKARYIDTVRNDFVVVGNTFDASDGNVPYRIRWCGIDAPTSWAVSASTQADFQDLDSADGWVKQVVGGTQMTVFQEKSITIGTYIGSPNVFRFDKVVKDKGTQFSNGVSKLEGAIAFAADDGFYILSNSQLIPIGSGKVDKYFINNVDFGFSDRVSCVVDQTKKIIIWCYPNSSANNGVANQALIYNYSSNAKKRWTRAEFEAQFIYNQPQEGYNMDNMDADYPNLDLIGISLDSRFWTGGQISLAGFNGVNKAVSFTGTPYPSTIITGERQLSKGKTTYIHKVRPQIVNYTGTLNMQIGCRGTQNETVSYTGSGTVNNSGDIPLRCKARYQRIKLNITGDYDDAIGAQIVKAIAGGDR